MGMGMPKMASRAAGIAGAAVLAMMALSSCATDPVRPADGSEGPVHAYVGMSKTELVRSLGPADDVAETSGATWLHYARLHATFAVSRESSVVIAGLYPKIDAYGRADAGRPDLGHGVRQGMTRQQVEQQLGHPTLSAPLAWTYCGLQYPGARGTPVFVTLEFKYVHPNDAVLNNIRLDGRCLTDARPL